MKHYGTDMDRSRSGDGRFDDWIPVSKVNSFKILFNRVRDKIGGYEKARIRIGLSPRVMDGLNKGKCSRTTAKKIYNAYNNICKKGIANDAFGGDL